MKTWVWCEGLKNSKLLHCTLDEANFRFRMKAQAQCILTKIYHLNRNVRVKELPKWQFSPLLIPAWYNPFKDKKKKRIYFKWTFILKSRVVLSKKERIESFSVLAQIGRQVLKHKKNGFSDLCEIKVTEEFKECKARGSVACTAEADRSFCSLLF